MEDLVKILEILKKFTDLIQGDQAFISSIIPLTKLVLKKINNKVQEGADSALIEEFLRCLITAITYRFARHFRDIDLNIASFLDPRFKDSFLESDYTVDLITEILVKELDLLSKTMPDLFDIFDIYEKSLNSRKIKVEEEEDLFWKEFENSNMLGDKHDKVLETEIKLYLVEKMVSKEIDPSIYWSLNKSKYPKISILARKYLTPLPTSAYSERCFSLSSNIITKKRSRLCPEMAEILVFLNKNLQLSSIVK